MSCFEDGFRLAGVPSECSLKSKARIDALFGDTRSICSSTAGGWYTEVSTMASLANADDIGAEEQRRVNRAVQARIEAMFASVEAESGTPGECAAAILPVRYLGAAPVGGRVASVRGLQEPLRQLLERLDDAVSAELEVSRRGLTFRTSESCEKNNPFRRIAVWSALRLRARRTASGELSYAFLPLVGDDQGPGSEEKHADLYRSMRGLKSDVGAYPPIFAVIMRRPRAARLLECHAFACHVEEDAVAAAATLYRALLADLDANRRRPRQANGVGCASLASVASSVRDPSPSSRKNGVLSPPLLPPTPPRPTAPHPVRPPRTKKSSISSVTEEEPSSNGDGLKNPRRRKKNSDVKAEDVLEARHRGHPGDPAVPVTRNNTSSTVKGNNNKYFAAAKDGGALSGMEQRENLRNILCDAKPEMDGVSGRRIELCISSERIYSDKRSVESGDGKVISVCDVYSRKLNEYEKMPTKGSLYGFGKKSERTDGCGAVVGKGGDKSNDERNGGNDDVIYGKNEGSYDLQRNIRNDGRSNKREIYSSKSEAVKMYDRHVESSACAKDRSPDIYAQKQSVNRRSQEKLYEEHFRDAEKIYSLDQEDVVSRSRNERVIDATHERHNNRDNVQYFTKSKPRQDQLSSRNTTAVREKPLRSSRASSRQNQNSSGRESLYSGGHSGCGVSTLDKPLKREKVPGALGNSEIPEYTKPRTRRSSRAGSEPPRSRSEEAEDILREVKLKRAQSDLDVDRGDLMTRVELPRRGSFLNSGSTRRVNNVTGGTPLGFTELFDEFRNQEGLTSVDDILAAIIDPEGMSFNDLKPLYKEFLLKLAATLTQDELYQRSASIMRRRKRPQRRRSTRHSGLLGRAIKRSVSRLKGSGPTEFTSVIFPARKLNDSFGSSSSCDARNNNRNRVLASRLGRRRSSWRRNKPGMGQTTSEDSDTGRRLGKGTAANRSSSGYVSCSECSYDSESCTCVSADKCYCSLSRRIPVPPVPAGPTAVCACDTDSCSESNKCYCARRPAHPTILEQLRQRGIVPSEGTLSRGESPERAKISRASRGHASSRSLEFLKIRQPLIASSSDNLALDYDLFSPGKSSQQSSDGEKVLVVSARDPQGRLVYVGGAKRDKRSSSNGSESHHEALSIKKSAEIAAVFGRGSSRTYRRASNASSLRSSASMEAGLGYLP